MILKKKHVNAQNGIPIYTCGCVREQSTVANARMEDYAYKIRLIIACENVRIFFLTNLTHTYKENVRIFQKTKHMQQPSMNTHMSQTILDIRQTSLPFTRIRTTIKSSDDYQPYVWMRSF